MCWPIWRRRSQAISHGPKRIDRSNAVRLAAQICLDMNADGHRADIVLVKTASSLAAFNLKGQVEADDIYKAAELVLPHRMHKRQNRQTGSRKEEFRKRLDEHKGGKPQEQKKEKEGHEKKKPLMAAPGTAAQTR